MISFIFDAILIAICVFTIMISVKQGFVRTVLSAVSSIAAILISVLLTPPVSAVFYDNLILPPIANGIENTVRSLAGSGNPEEIANMLETMPDILSDILDRYNVSDDMISHMLREAQVGSATVESISRSIASPVASTISNVIAFTICFVITSLILRIILGIIDKIFKFPVLKSANKIAGFILGAVLAIVIMLVFSNIAVQLSYSLGSVAPDIFGKEAIDKTVFIKFFSGSDFFGLIGDTLNRDLLVINNK